MAMPITRGTIPGPQRVVLYGVEGIGKTTLASKFPAPVFIDCEGSTRHLDVARTPVPTSWAKLFQIIASLQSDRQGYQSLVIDTIDWAQRLCVQHVCAVGLDGKARDSIEGFGYGKGFTILAEEWGRFLDSLTALSNTGMHIVLLAHSATRKFELPEEMGSYDRGEMKLEKKASALAKEWADCVLFANYKVYVVESEVTKKNKASGGNRILKTTYHPCWDAKNRYGLPDELPLDFAAIVHCFPALDSAPTNTAVQPPVTVTPVAVSLAVAPTPEPVKYTELPEPSKRTGPLNELLDLMQADGIAPSELQAAIFAAGHFPPDTPLENLPDKYINGMLLPQWQRVVARIKNVVGETANV